MTTYDSRERLAGDGTRATRWMTRMALGMALALVAGGALAQQWEREQDASPGEVLRLELEAGGSVDIKAWNRNSVKVTASGRDANGSGDIELSLTRSGGTHTFKTEYVGSRRSWSSRLSFEISVPSTFDIDIDSTGGGVSIDGVEGRFEGETMGGALRLTNVRGVARLETMGGNIDVSDSDLDGKVSTMGGKVNLRDIVGDLDGSSMGGNVSLVRVTRRNGSGTGDTVNISTMGGAVEVNDAPAGARLSTMGGKIQVESAREFVDAKTMGGNIDIQSIEGWVKAVTMGGDVEVRVVGEGSEGADVHLESMGGDIRLVVPPGFGMELDIELSYTKRHVGKHDIRSDVPFQRSESPEWIRDHGSDRKIIFGKGTVGDGRHKVKIRTINGDVVINEG